MYQRFKGVFKTAYRVLLVEDDSQIREVVEDCFSAKSEGDIAVVTAQDGSEGLELIRSEEFDLVLLDIMLPGVDGFTICREIRRTSIVPVLFLTARATEADVLHGYELGCDDYIIKPFSPAALYAKVSAMLKRVSGTVISRELVCGKISMDMVSFEVRSDGKPVELAPKEFALLKYMMEHKNCVVDRDTLLNRVWGYDFFGNDRVVDNHIKKLRKALGDSAVQIKTVIGRGYRFTE
ncbi:MAG: response regulator transcription factor [Oscillospiraceae bacterium]|nr:response regulator transcription factor [Oscillospiraceae bacterium]